MQRGANLLGDGLRPVDQLHVPHRRVVAVAAAALEDPQVAARAALVARAEIDAQLADRFRVAQARAGQEAVRDACGLGHRYPRLGHAAQITWTEDVEGKGLVN